MKTCKDCQIKKSLSEYYLRKSWNGKRYPRSVCKTCHIKVSKSRLKEKPPTKEYRRLASKKWRDAHPGYANQSNKKSREKNPTKNYLRVKVWRKANPGSRKAEKALRRAALIQATPKWITKDMKKEINKFYRECPKGFHVDHIIPLNGKTVKGWHVPWNLQYLSAQENVRKSNRLVG